MPKVGAKLCVVDESQSVSIPDMFVLLATDVDFE